MAEKVNSTTLQDYSEYQLSFRQDNKKSSQTPLDNHVIPDGHFSARQLSESLSKSPEIYQRKSKNSKVYNSAS